MKAYEGDGVVAALVVKENCAHEHQFTSEGKRYLALKTQISRTPVKRTLL